MAKQADFLFYSTADIKGCKVIGLQLQTDVEGSTRPKCHVKYVRAYVTMETLASIKKLSNVHFY